MTKMTLADAYSIVDDNFDQTFLVKVLFDKCVFNRWMVMYLPEEDIGSIVFIEDLKHSDLPDIYQWIVMPKLLETDFANLIEGWIPVLRTYCGDWIGITSNWSHYDTQIYPKLIKILFNIDTNYQEIRTMKKNR